MLCTVSGKPAKFCVPTKWDYKRGCRCDRAKKLHAEWFNPYQRVRKGSMAEPATCPMCGSETYRESGFCRGCEARR